MKKKSPPWAFIGAILLFAVFAFALWKWKQAQDQKIADEQARTAEAVQEANNAKATGTAPTLTVTPADSRPVLFATQPVEPGVKLSPAFYEHKLTPNDILPDAYTDSDNISGWVAVRQIEKGDPLTPRNIGKTLPYMSQRITPGMRLIALNVFNADANGTGGFAVDGDYVDLIFTAGTKTQMAMQNVKIAFIPGPTIKSEQTGGVNPAPSPNQTLAVTFEVTPEEAQALIGLLGSGSPGMPGGRFTMILRSRKDTTVVKIRPFDSSQYVNSIGKVQKVIDRAGERVAALEKEIQAREQAQSQGNTNETTSPTPPSP